MVRSIRDFIERCAWTKEDFPGLIVWAAIIGGITWSFWGEPIPLHHKMAIKPFMALVTLVLTSMCIAFALGCEWYRRETAVPFVVSMVGSTMLYLGIVMHACTFTTYFQVGAYWVGLLAVLALHDVGLVMTHGLHGAPYTSRTS